MDGAKMYHQSITIGSLCQKHCALQEFLWYDLFMKSAQCRIKRVLKSELDTNEIDPQFQAFKLVTTGVVLSQILGHTLAQLASLSAQLTNPLILILGIAAGLILFTSAAGIGSFHFQASGESEDLAFKKFLGLEEHEGAGSVRLFRDLHRALRICLNRSEHSPLVPAPAASVLVDHLLDHGLTPESQLEVTLTQAGFRKSTLNRALQWLEDGGFISVKANGVNLIPAKRRLFL